MRARAEHDVRRVAAIQARAVGDRRMTVLEQLLALLRQTVPGAGATCSTRIGDRPCDPVPGGQGPAGTSAHDPADGLVAQHTGHYLSPRPVDRVEVGPADGREIDGHEDFAGGQVEIEVSSLER